MITLITGAPGAGKSAALVDLLREIAAKGRPVYVDGIPKLKIPHEVIEAAQWAEVVPDGAVVVIDEVQRVWRPTGPGQRVPGDIAALETHRHRGLDFFIVTQHPKLVHANVRNLVGRHIHLRDVGVLGRFWYEWPEAADPGTWRSAPFKKRYRLPRSAFSLYESASEHIKPSRSFPRVLLVLGVAVVGVGVLGWKVYGSVTARLAPAAAAAGASAPAAGPVGKTASVAPAPASETAELLRQFVPRLSHRPETAPAYDALRVVVAMPLVVGGYCQGAVCRCQTQQGTDAGIGVEACRAWIANPPFNPYRAPEPAVQSTPAATTNALAPQQAPSS